MQINYEFKLIGLLQDNSSTRKKSRVAGASVFNWVRFSKYVYLVE